ncbi:MAG: protein kinase [Candidatus Marinimicrobia bacterium]|nr:protein kinase [Candidatus Neomarinimicrobiota bacterium]
MTSLNFSSAIFTDGELPEPLRLEELLDRKRLAELASQVYDQRTNLVCRVDTDRGPTVVKWFGWRHPGHYLLSPTFPGRAVTSWRIARAISALGARTPEPLFVYSRRSFGLIQENIYVCRAIHPHQTLRAFLQSDAPRDQKLAAVTDLAGSIARLHAGHILHRDLTTANLLVTATAEVYIIDLNRGQQVDRLSRHRRLQDLARLNFHTGDDLESQLVAAFFGEYSSGDRAAADWVSDYRQARGRLLNRKAGKRRLRQLLGGK